MSNQIKFKIVQKRNIFVLIHSYVKPKLLWVWSLAGNLIPSHIETKSSECYSNDCLINLHYKKHIIFKQNSFFVKPQQSCCVCANNLWVCWLKKGEKKVKIAELNLRRANRKFLFCWGFSWLDCSSISL